MNRRLFFLTPLIPVATKAAQTEKAEVPRCTCPDLFAHCDLHAEKNARAMAELHRKLAEPYVPPHITRDDIRRIRAFGTNDALNKVRAEVLERQLGRVSDVEIQNLLA